MIVKFIAADLVLDGALVLAARKALLGHFLFPAGTVQRVLCWTRR